MNTNNLNIDKIIRDKFELYSPVPPKHIWAGIESGLNSEPIIPLYKNRKVILASLIAVLAILAYFLVFNNPISNKLEDTIKGQRTIVMEDEPSESASAKSVSINVVVDELLPVKEGEELKKSAGPIVIELSDDSDIPVSTELTKTNITDVNSVTIIDNNSFEAVPQTTKDNTLSIIKLKKSAFVIDGDYDITLEAPNHNSIRSPIEIVSLKSTNVNSHWEVAGYLSPEIAITNFDSVEMLNAYTFSIEPTYTINNHWFVRSGVGLSYVRDRGFAEINYISNDYIGSYDDVYDITFDTISGVVTPIYHTKTVEVWDSVHHVTVSNVTNKYFYLQVPLLLGYTFKNKDSNINWYFMGGPAVNVKISSWIDNPQPLDNDAEIISLHNNLPVRSNSYFQFWIGAGLEYQLNNRLSLAVEPIYRYYFSSIYNSSYMSTSSSGLTLRVGIVYKIK